MNLSKVGDPAFAAQQQREAQLRALHEEQRARQEQMRRQQQPKGFKGMAGITQNNSRTPLVNNPRKHASRYDLKRCEGEGQGVRTRCDEEARATAKMDAAE